MIKKKIIALFCSVLVLVSVFALTCAAKPSDVDNLVEDPIYLVDNSGLEAGGVAYLMTWKTYEEENYLRYYNCLSTSAVLSLELSDFTPEIESIKVSNTTVNGSGDIIFTFSYTWHNDGGEYEYQPCLHDSYGRSFHTVKYTVTFLNDDVENPLYIGDISLVKTPYLTEANTIRYYYGFFIDKLGHRNYKIDVDFYDYNESQNYPLPCSLTYSGRFHVDSVENVVIENFELGKLEGYNIGFSDGCASMEKWDFYTMLTTVVTAPLTLINGALNFDVFGINIASFVKLAVTALLLFALFKFIMSLVRGG